MTLLARLECAIAYYRQPHTVEERHGDGYCCCIEIAYALEAVLAEHHRGEGEA